MIFEDHINVNPPQFIPNLNEPWQLENLNHITVIFGKNGSGKSIILRQIRDLDIESCHYIIPERTGPLVYEPNYQEEQRDATRRRGASDNNFISEYRSRVISRIHSYFTARGVTRGDQLPGRIEDLEELLKYLLTDFELTLVDANPPFKMVRLALDEQISEINQLSSGEAQLMTISLDTLTIAAIWDIQETEKRILLLDEPDLHLHPDLQVRFADFLSQVAEKYKLQMFIATHSTTLLSALGQFGKTKCSTIFLQRGVNRYKALPFDDYLKELSTCLGGHVLMGPLFGAPLLLVEGDDDYRVWSQVPRHLKVNIAVIPTHGEEIKKYQKTLEKLFGSLSTPKVMGHALLDGDKTMPSDQNTPQEYIPFIKLNCHECENLYLTDEVLKDLGLSWSQAVEKIKVEAEKFGNKKSALIEITKQDRRISDLKQVIKELNIILDSKNVHWTLRVARRLGIEKPKGQLFDFLGENVVKAIWERL